MGFAQWNQDWFLYQNFFKGKRDGVFVDIGAMGAFELSNTAVFEQCLDWKGLCVEPNPVQHLILRGYRKCVLVPKCIAGTSGEKIFALDYSGTVLQCMTFVADR